MPFDPSAIQTTPEGRNAEKIADLDRRIRNLETAPTIQVGAGSPVTVGNEARDGTPYASTTTPRLWIKVGGTWRFTTLT